MNQYLEFLRGKIQVAPETGFEVDPTQVNPALKPHQRDAVIWACRGGRRGYTIELNNDYFRDAVGYLKEFEAKEETISLFDMIG